MAAKGAPGIGSMPSGGKGGSRPGGIRGGGPKPIMRSKQMVNHDSLIKQTKQP